VNVLVALPILLPILGAALSLVVHRRLWAQRVIGVGVLSTLVVVSVVLLVRVRADGIVVVDVGGWQAPAGITLVADLFAVMMLGVSTVVLLAVFVYAMGSGRASEVSLFFHPVYLVLAAGVSASFLTGDLFNLFVAFEIMLCASYVLLTLGGRPDQVRTGMTYVVISLLASTLFISAVGLIYAATGTVNMADLAMRLDDVSPATRDALGLLLLVVFGIKAAIFPLFFWLPDSYPAASTSVTAIFAGLLTKVGVYAIIRTQTLLFPSDGPSTLLIVVAGATMVVGVLGAIAQNDIKRILSFHIVSQIGYMIFGLALFTVAGLAAALLYIVHHIVVKTALFLVTGLVEATTGTGALHRLGGLMRRSPVIAALFVVPALSLAGLPPFSGFVAKLGLVQAGTEVDRYGIVAVSLAVSALTLFSMSKIWAGAFWGDPPANDADEPITDELVASSDGTSTRPPRTMVAATLGLVVVSLAVTAFAGPLHELSTDAAEQLMDPDRYVSAVLAP
jgi:multicomponent Na+:H+ antiporter subunit D